MNNDNLKKQTEAATKIINRFLDAKCADMNMFAAIMGLLNNAGNLAGVLASKDPKLSHKIIYDNLLGHFKAVLQVNIYEYMDPEAEYTIEKDQ